MYIAINIYPQFEEVCPKGQLTSKCLFGVFNFSQNTNENKLTWGIIVVKSNFFLSFFGRIEDTKKSFWNYLTFKGDLISKCLLLLLKSKKKGANSFSWAREMHKGVNWHLCFEVWAKVKDFLRLSQLQHQNLTKKYYKPYNREF